MPAKIKTHSYSRNTAQLQMKLHLLKCGKNDTVGDLLELIKKHEEELSSNVYIVENQKLIGIVRLSEALKSGHEIHLSKLMRKNFISIHPHTDCETAARLAVHHSENELPVVDKDMRIFGILDSNTILKTLHEENIEDLLRAAGYRHNHENGFINVLKARAGLLIKARMPWLLIGLAGGMLSTFMLSSFGKALERNIVLAFFMPVIVYMASAVGTQTEAMFLRLYDTGGFKIHSHLLKEIKVAAGIGIISGTLIFLFTYLFFKTIAIASVVGISMFATIIASVLIATFIPATIAKLGKDPAIGSGPFATVIQDILSLVIYLSVAWLLL